MKVYYKHFAVSFQINSAYDILKHETVVVSWWWEYRDLALGVDFLSFYIRRFYSSNTYLKRKYRRGYLL